MIRKQSAELNRLRSLAARFMTPNIIKYEEYEKPGSHRSTLTRLMIRQEKDATFSVLSVRVGHKLDRYSADCDIDGEKYTQLFFAQQKLDELTTISELNGYEHVDEFSGAIHDVSSLRYQGLKPRFSVSARFTHDNKKYADDFLCQHIPGGLHVLVKINAYGDISMHDYQNENTTNNATDLINANIKNYLIPLIRRDGFRGALLEAFFDGEHLYVVDAGYLHNKSLYHVPFENRVVYINSILANLEQKNGCRFIYPSNKGIQAWTDTYRNGLKKAALIKLKGGLFAVQPTNRFEQAFEKMDAGVILSEVEAPLYLASNCSNEGIELSPLDNSQPSLTIWQLAKLDSLCLNEYTIVGQPSKLIPLMF